ncbi:MAG: 4,5-DOPA dioxygenase extradiol [Bacteriovoracaceae bacterium]|nr:4,5-DOPA dioxygenase extradiol [Bacteriovoracaceae bacterium]
MRQLIFIDTLVMRNERLPVLFIGHGSPMNALEDNSWSQHLQTLAKQFPTPKGIICLSAHWMTATSKKLNVEAPKTIHDFHGFPEALYQIQYNAPGLEFKEPNLGDDDQWGYDHGCWSVLTHMYPEAKIPVSQISLSSRYSMKEHFKQAEKFRHLRDEGYLLIGSGNITHNLRDLDFRREAKPRDWAVEFDERTKEALTKRDYAWLWNEKPQYKKLFQVAHPTLEHYYPLLYTLGLSYEDEELSFPYEEIQAGSISMRSVLYQ